MPNAVVRELPQEEWPQWEGKAPFDQTGFPHFPGSRVIVSESEGEIVGYWMVFPAWHVEPFWIHPDHRAKPGTLRKMWRAVRKTLEEVQAQMAFAVIMDRDLPGVGPQALGLGFKKVMGSLFFVSPADSKDLGGH